MKSNGWKVTLFAVAAVVMLSACGEDKKAKPSSPYAGIWVQQKNLQEYSAYRGELLSNNRNGFCQVVEANHRRYGDSQFRMTAISISANGEVFRYSPGDSVTTVGFREQNFRGTINAAGVFTPGSIGPDGLVNSSYGHEGFGLPSQSTVSVRGNVMTFWVNGRTISFERHSKVIIDQYAEHVVSCLTIISEQHYDQQGPAARPLPPRKDCDPRIQRCGGPRVLPLPAQPGLEYGPGAGAVRPGRAVRPGQAPAFRPEAEPPGLEQGPPLDGDEQD